jgi:hypothetical protein
MFENEGGRGETGLATAYATDPERFRARLPHPQAPPVEVWINDPGPERRRRLADLRVLAAVSLARETRAVTLSQLLGDPV